MPYPENIEDILLESRQDKQPQAASWDICLHYLGGHQHLERDSRDEKWIVDTTNRNRTTTNKILPIYRTVTAKMMIGYPSVGITPASKSWEDITKGLASEQALHYYWSTEDLKYKIGSEASSWLTSCGTCALHTYYDPGEKKVHTEVISPYDLFFEAKARREEHSSFISIRHLVHRQDAIESYPDYAEYLEKAPQASTEKYGRRVPEDTLSIHTTYWKDGTYAVTCGNTYLFKGKTPEKLMPIQVLRYTRLPNQIWGMGLVYPLVGPQNQYNEQRSQQLLFIRLNANAPWLVSRQSQVGRITNKQGQKILWSGLGPEPKRMVPASLPSDVWTNTGTIEKEMQDIAGVHHVTMGRSVPAIKSGAAIEAITSKDETQLAVTNSEIEKAAANMCKTVLVYMKKYYSRGLMIRMFDHLGSPMFKEIKSTDFVNVPEVIIAPGSLFTADVQQRDATILNLYQQGLMPPEMVMQELSMRTGNKFIADKMAALSHARDILEACKSGLLVEVHPDDDLDAFKKVFGEYLRSEEYYNPKPDTLDRLNQQEIPYSDVQEYIRDVYVSILSFGQPVETYQQVSKAKVFPRQEPPQASPSAMMATGSVAAQGQMAVEQQRGAAMRQAQQMQQPQQPEMVPQ